MKKKFKKFFQKSLSVLMVVGIFISSFSGIPLKIPEVHAMSGVSGDKIIEVAQSYSNYTYDNVGTCTGLVTRVLNKLGIAQSIVGIHPYNIDTPQSEGGARYAPSGMYRNAFNHPEDAQLIFQGYVKDLIKVPEILKNGDLAIQRPEDKSNYSGSGHVGFIHLYGNSVAWFGANGSRLGIGDMVLVADTTTGGGHKDISGEDYITVFRLTKSEPEYAKTSATKSAIERVEVSFRKTDVETGKVLEGVQVDFLRDGVKFASGTTNSLGIATATYNQSYSSTSEEKEYVTNYDELDDDGRRAVDERGAFHYYEDAQAEADSEAQSNANAQASQTHRYSVVETQTKTKYWLDDNNKTVSDSMDGSGSISLSLTNERVRATAKLKKVDYDTKGKAQNEGSLDNALYGLYAKSNILDPADASIIYHAGDEVFRGRTQNGEITVTDLFLGDYEWRELSASEGYFLNPTAYAVKLEYAGQTVKTVVAKTTVTEKVITGNFEIEKVITSGDESEITEKEEGAEFIAVAEKYVIKYGSIEEAWEHRDEYTDKEYDYLVTDSNGYAKSRDLAYGKIRIKQIKGKLDTEKVKDEWTFTISKENQDTIKYIINNTIFKSYVRLVKKDVETGKTITLSNTTFKIVDLSTNELLTQKVGKETFEEWTTDSNGEFVLPLEVRAGNFKLIEIKSPDLYLVNNEGVEFSVTTSNIIETDSDGDPILTVTMYDQAVKGQINVEKHGEVLTNVKKEENGNYTLIYENKCVAGMIVEIKAREDIIDPADGSVLYEKGTIVDTIKTGNTCENKSILLPLGKFTVYEVEAPFGMILNTKEYDVDLTFADENTPVVMETVSITNERQKVDLDITKLDKEDETPIEGAFFGLYATKDIVVKDDNNEDKVLIKSGTLIETSTSDADGKVIFNSDLPLTADDETYFEVKEIKSKEGYYLNEEPLSIDTKYKGQNTERFTSEGTLYNKPIVNYISVNKVDSLTGETIIDKDFTFGLCKDSECNNIIAKVESNKEDGTAFFTIKYGVEMFIRELSSPEGYSLSDEVVKVLLNKDGLYVNDELVEVDEDLIYSFNYENNPLHYILVNKVDSLTMQNILSKDFSFNLCEDYECNNIVETFSANQEDGTAFIPVKFGTWFIKEGSAPLGYALSSEVVKVEVSKDGLFINDNKVETDEDLVYSIVYQDSLLPVIQTGVNDNPNLFLIIGGSALVGMSTIIISLIKKKKQK